MDIDIMEKQLRELIAWKKATEAKLDALTKAQSWDTPAGPRPYAPPEAEEGEIPPN